MTVDDSGYFSDAWERFLRRYTWDLYGHLTFRDNVTYPHATNLFRKFIHKLNRHLYGHNYWKHHTGLRWIRGEELQKREVIHFHTLIGHGPVVAAFDRTLTAEVAQTTWTRLAGDGLVEPYNPALDGIAYLTKKYHPGYGHIDISSNLEAAPS